MTYNHKISLTELAYSLKMAAMVPSGLNGDISKRTAIKKRPYHHCNGIQCRSPITTMAITNADGICNF